MKMIKSIIILLISVICLVGCDLTTKEIAKEELRHQQVKSYVGGSVKLTYAENNGGMLSFGSNLSKDARIIIFKILVSIFLAMLLGYLIFKKDIDKWEKFALILFLSGGLGNLINRFTYDGNVIDFMVLEMFSLRTGIFNVADMYVTFGVAIFIFLSFIKKKEEKITV